MSIRSILYMLPVLLLHSCAARATRSPGEPAPKVFDVNIRSLAANRSRIYNKDAALMPAYTLLIKDADKAMAYGPVSVMEKKNLPPSGDKHDYMSLAPYFWPDPSKPDGLPYLRKDGQVNPEVKDYKDKEYLPAVSGAIYTLGLAYYFSGEERYAEHAARLIRAWYLDPATRMNPNLNYGQAIKGRNDGRGAGLIDTRHMIKVIDAIGLINASKWWKAADQQGMQTWFASFLNWMQTSKNGLDEMAAPNNHGAWYDAQRLSMALFIDSLSLARSIVGNAAMRLDKQIDSKGQFPKEMERTTSLGYTAFVMNAFFSIARQAETLGVDLWTMKTPSGKSLRMAFDELYPYLLQPSQWKGEQIKTFDPEDGFSLLLDAAANLGCSNCRANYQSLAGDKKDRLRLNLLY